MLSICLLFLFYFMFMFYAMFIPSRHKLFKDRTFDNNPNPKTVWAINKYLLNNKFRLAIQERIMIETILVPSLDIRPFTFLMVLINMIQ